MNFLRSLVVMAAYAWTWRAADKPEPAKPAPRPVPPPAPKPAPAPVLPAAQREIGLRLLALHNAERARAGLLPLTYNERLAAAALVQARDLARRAEKDPLRFHVGSDGSQFFDRIGRAGYRYVDAGENAGWNERDEAEAVAAWMASPGHRANILGPFVEFGAAVVDGGTGPYWIVDLADPA